MIGCDNVKKLPLDDLNFMNVLPHIYDRANWISRSARIESFLYMDSSLLIVLNGCDSRDELRSPVTLWTIMLRDQNQGKKIAKYMFWFAGYLPNLDARHVTIGLISQLFHYGIANMPADPNKLAIAKGNDPFAYSCKTLVPILVECIKKQLQYTSVVCVIDAVNVYEDAAARNADMQYLFDQLAYLVTTEAGVYPFKLMITSTTTTRLADNCPTKVVVNVPLPENVPQAPA